MKIYKILFIFGLFVGTINQQVISVTPAQCDRNAAQAAILNAKVRAAFKDVLGLGDIIRILKFASKNQKLFDKIPVIIERVETKINNNSKAAAKFWEPDFAVKRTCHMYSSKTTAIPEAAQLIQTIQDTSVTDVLINTLTLMAQITAKVSHALSEAADIINHLVDLLKLFNNQNQDILKEVLEQTLDKSELTALNDFVQSETPTRLCKAIEQKPCGFIDVIKELLKQYKSTMFCVKSKIMDIKSKLTQRSAAHELPKTI